MDILGSEKVGSAYDLIFVGGGLANGLAAYRMQQYRPELKILLVDAGAQLGGHHTWSFHKDDIRLRQRSWLTPFISKAWSAYDVYFPQFSRTVVSAYFSIRSERFHHVIMERMRSNVVLNAKATRVTPTQVDLDNGTHYEARCVIDGRGWPEGATLPVGYQKFIGLDVRLREPHGLHHPILMDVTQEQKDGFRFFYVLPWSERTLLVEDTRYSESAELNDAELRKEIESYIQHRGWAIQEVLRREKGVLPIPLEGNLPPGIDGVALSGMRAGLFHSTTGYSLPQAVQFADQLVELGRYDHFTVLDWSTALAKRHWEKESFFRLLNRMLFRAADPPNRFKVLQRFYRFPDDMIARFYAGKMKSFDHLRVLTGKPPVPIGKAIRCLFEKESVS